MNMRHMVYGTATAVAMLAAVTPALAEDCEDSPSGFWERTTALGTFDGARTELCKKGVQLGATHQSEYLNNPTGGLRNGGKYQGRTEFDLDLDGEKMADLAGLTAHASAMWINGGRLGGKNLGALMGPSNIEAVPGLRLYTLWVQQNLWEDKVSVRLGQLAADDEFAVSKVSALFLNSTFGWPAMISGNIPSGGPGFPLATPGARVTLALGDGISWMTGVFAGDPAGRPNGQDAQFRNKNGTNFSLAEGTFTMTEAAYAVNQGKDDAGLAASYKLGGWYNSERFNDQRWDSNGVSLANTATTTGTGKPVRGDWGIYGVVDQMLLREKAGGDQGLSAFLRAGGSPSDRNVIAYYFDTGLAYKGLLADRPDDTVGLAVAYAAISSSLQSLDRDTQAFNNQGSRPVRNAETAIELSYQAAVTPWMTIQPDVQYIVHPGGNVPNPQAGSNLNAVGDALVIGARTAIKF
jgi:porin